MSRASGWRIQKLSSQPRTNTPLRRRGADVLPGHISRAVKPLRLTLIGGTF